jgi:hypothetical protein
MVRDWFAFFVVVCAHGTCVSVCVCFYVCDHVRLLRSHRWPCYCALFVIDSIVAPTAPQVEQSDLSASEIDEESIHSSSEGVFVPALLHCSSAWRTWLPQPRSRMLTVLLLQMRVNAPTPQ